MNKIIIIFLAFHFISFFGCAVIWRNYIVAKKTGVNVFKLDSKKGPEAITGWYFKYLPLLSVLVFTLYAIFPLAYKSIGPISLIDYEFIQWLGMILMLVSLVWVIIAQSQMGSSWRIGIDHDETTKLVQQGVFRYSRNPIFIGIIFISFGFFLLLPNALTLIILVLDIALIQIQVSLEEQFLEDTHNDVYLKYCKQVRRWL
jgi:protein-S-isoprenylcysteine O-methyltransferase Ste14